MKNIFKKIAVGCFALLAAGLAANAQVIATNVAAGGTYLLSTNRASIYSVEITSSNPVQVDLYDADSLAAPYYGTNYVNAAYQYRTTYTTNYVTSFVGSTGYTNWYTNAGLWTLTLTNAANTNQLPKAFSAVVAGNSYAVYPTSTLLINGVVMRASTNVAITILYRPGT